MSNPPAGLSFGELKDLAFAFADSVAAMYVGTIGELENETLLESIPPPNERCFLWCASFFRDGEWLGSSIMVLFMVFVVGFGLISSVTLCLGFGVKRESKSSSSLLFESWVSTH